MIPYTAIYVYLFCSLYVTGWKYIKQEQRQSYYNQESYLVAWPKKLMMFLFT